MRNRDSLYRMVYLNDFSSTCSGGPRRHADILWQKTVCGRLWTEESDTCYSSQKNVQYHRAVAKTGIRLLCRGKLPQNSVLVDIQNVSPLAKWKSGDRKPETEQNATGSTFLPQAVTKIYRSKCGNTLKIKMQFLENMFRLISTPFFLYFVKFPISFALATAISPITFYCPSWTATASDSAHDRTNEDAVMWA